MCRSIPPVPLLYPWFPPGRGSLEKARWSKKSERISTALLRSISIIIIVSRPGPAWALDRCCAPFLPAQSGAEHRGSDVPAQLAQADGDGVVISNRGHGPF